jgi:predicted MFS family arabinose efflux permease
VVEHYAIAGGSAYDWRSIWLFAGVASALVLALFLPSFPKEKVEEGMAAGMEEAA